MSVTRISVRDVTQVVRVRVLPTPAEAVALRATLTTCNVAALWLSAVMHRERVLGKHDAQKRFYTELKQRFGLAAQPAIRVIAKVADAYTTLRANIDAGNYGPPGSPKRKKATATPSRFRVDAAQPFDARCLSWQIPETVGAREATVSIWTTQGRRKGVRVLAAPHDLVMLRTQPVRETDLIYRNGKWFLYAAIEVTEAPLADPSNGFVGVDMGIVNIATTSTGDKATVPGSTATGSANSNCGNGCKPRKLTLPGVCSKSGDEEKPASPPISITRFRNTSWPRLNAPNAVLPSKN
jgi:putative transposase